MSFPHSRRRQEHTLIQGGEPANKSQAAAAASAVTASSPASSPSLEGAPSPPAPESVPTLPVRSEDSAKQDTVAAGGQASQSAAHLPDPQSTVGTTTAATSQSACFEGASTCRSPVGPFTVSSSGHTYLTTTVTAANSGSLFGGCSERLRTVPSCTLSSAAGIYTTRGTGGASVVASVSGLAGACSGGGASSGNSLAACKQTTASQCDSVRRLLKQHQRQQQQQQLTTSTATFGAIGTPGEASVTTTSTMEMTGLPTTANNEAAPSFTAEQHGGTINANGTSNTTCNNNNNNVKQCAGCAGKIIDRFLLHAMDRYWHTGCLKCSCCQAPLGEIGTTCFTKAGMILCKNDYIRLFGSTGTCTACGEPIPASEFVMKAQGNVYHLNCFTCVTCHNRLVPGDRYSIINGSLICEHDYPKVVRGHIQIPLRPSHKVC